MKSTHDMADRHEAFLASAIDGRRCPGSGNQSANQLDVRNDPRRQRYAFGLDGKSTMSRSITVTLDMWEKACMQAHDLRPGFGLRWYHDERLRDSTDLIVVSAHDFESLLAEARYCAG